MQLIGVTDGAGGKDDGGGSAIDREFDRCYARVSSPQSQLNVPAPFQIPSTWSDPWDDDGRITHAFATSSTQVGVGTCFWDCHDEQPNIIVTVQGPEVPSNNRDLVMSIRRSGTER